MYRYGVNRALEVKGDLTIIKALQAMGFVT
jgi:hypothetical protein